MHPIYPVPRVKAVKVYPIRPANREEDMPQPRHYNPEYCLGLETNAIALVQRLEELEAYVAQLVTETIVI